ncbi:MAG TPA: molybdenum cofactor biosynthesis protein MoaE [Gemmatimonadaceae bacterium]|nr:molybdenum cofactor biosynthesis protein MoaE [Gemmatimonadaceae bacterium]
MRTALVTRAIDAPALLREVAAKEHGATSLFLGTVRDVNDGRAVTGIEYAAYAAMATAELDRIATEAVKCFRTELLVVEHRIGEIALGDVSVAIAVSHAHRAPALDATRYVIEQLKRRVPIWKREHYSDGASEWIDPTRSAREADAATGETHVLTFDPRVSTAS